jgi:hypothetical protein
MQVASNGTFNPVSGVRFSTSVPRRKSMRNFILGYIVGAFLTSFALSYNAAYTKAVRQEAIRSVYNPAKTETQKVEPMYSA